MQIQVIKRTFEILRVLDRQGALPLREVAAASRLRKTTVSNILRSLREEGIVEQDAAGNYRVSWGLRRFGANLPERLRPAAMTVAEEVVDELQEGVRIGCLDKLQPRLVASLEPAREIVVAHAAIGDPTAYGWSTSRALLMQLDDEALAAFVAAHGLPGEQWPEVKSLAGLRREVAALRRAGAVVRTSPQGSFYAFGVPAPVFDGRLAAAIGLFVPSLRPGGPDQETIIRILQAAARRLAERTRA